MFEDEPDVEGAAVVSIAGEALQALCQELNLDEGSAAEALDDFTAIRGHYSLEGEVIHWLACSLYVACRKSIIPTVGKGVMEGNCVSLTRILRSAKLSLIQFFNKMKKWMDMSNLPQEFRERIERLERNFEVSTVIFKKFEPIFIDLFQNPYEELPKLPRSRKQRKIPCSVKDLFNFCWTLFVYTKGNFRMIGDDLVNSYHLLLCCLDLIFANAIICPNRRDLLNPSFKGLPPDFHTTDFRASEEPPCIIAELCELHDGLLVEAKGIKEHYFKPYISKLFDRKILKGECLLDLSSFTDNSKAVNKEYEEYVLTVGDFDERIFLGADAEEEIGTPRKFTADNPLGKLTARANVECNLQQHFEKRRTFAPSTPLTGRRYLREKEAIITPVASATQSVSRLQGIVTGLKNAPSQQLIHIFESCMRNPMETITKIVKGIGMSFCQHYTQSTDEQPGSHIDFAVNRLKLAEILYYKILETVMVQETRRLHGMDMSVLLEQDIFNRSLMACCLEIVLFAYSSPRTFPWIIEVLDLQPFYFYKVIEVVIRSEEGLSRDMVKHLNSIEEQILESLAWSHDSALWEALQASVYKVPTCEEVNMQPLSPISVHERYSSPTAGSAKRRLFGEDPPKEMLVDKIMTEGTKLKIAPSSSVNTENISISPGQSLLTVATGILTGTTGQKVTIPFHGVANDAGGITLIPISMSTTQDSKVENPVSLTAQSLLGASPKQTHLIKAQEAHPTGISKPKRTGSLALFYRKVYHLASVRLRDLCLKLDISNELRRKIWTCFEFTLVHCSDLMKDRHLDQLLLCAFYIMAKVTKEERTFQEIMKSYRNQPQANSHVYRSVLLKSIPREVVTYNENINGDIEMTDCDLEDTTKTPDCSSGPVREERGDLIKFYNTVYVGKVKSFALKYDLSNQEHMMEAPPLSPYPHIKKQPGSPRRISQQHSIYVSPHKNGAGLTPRSALLYKFNGSPSKSLKDINNMIRQGEQKTKKQIITIEGDAESPAKRLCQENDDALLKRLQDVVSERAHH
ncbi:PREDICTED: retinoblastoma-like protein 1 [Chrysochloris asiatica]|uniref:Retinoblastoma-like protein 1 n=1 Tax=Chrysochloris asiatica TaxID=185453 RepID=A0A9B0U2Z1_CHRAS|nr:PREDICTED: retinoblastoma-like protein 1 [Chrysochloris asiatica]